MKKRTIFISALLVGLSVLAAFLIGAVDDYFVFYSKWNTENNPRYITMDKNGYLYVSGDSKVVKYGPDGVPVLKIQNIMNNDVYQLTSGNMGVAVDNSGNIYVLNCDQNNLMKFDADGNYITKWGSSGSGEGQFNFPLGIVVDAGENIYVGDRNNCRIEKFGSNGTFLGWWGRDDIAATGWHAPGSGRSCGYGGGEDGAFSGIRDLAFDSTTNQIYVLEDGNRRIQVFTTNGVFQNKVAIYNVIGAENALGFCIGPDGYFYVADGQWGANANEIWKIAPPGVAGAPLQVLGGVYGNDNYHFSVVWDVVFDHSGKLLVLDHQQNTSGQPRLMKYRPTGAPLIDILSPLSNASLSGTVTIQASVSMPDTGFTFNKVEFYRDTTKLGEATASPYDYIWNTTATTNGSYSIWAIASSNAGIAKAKVDIIVANGDAFPTVALTNPTLGSKIRGAVTLTATASDDVGVAKVEFFVDDTKVGQDTSSPFALDWNSTTVEDGEHEFKATATDSVGQSASSTVMAAVNNLEAYGFQRKWSVQNSSLAFNKAKTRLYVGGENKVRIYDLDGSLVQQIDSPGNGEYFDWEVYIAVDDAGNIYADCPSQNKIWIIDPTGKLIKTWGGTGKANYLYNQLREIALDNDGNIYIVDSGNHRIVKFNSSGTYVKAWGTQGGSNGQFNFPQGLTFDGTSYLYVVDAGNNRVQVFKLDGSFYKTWGVGGSSNGQLNQPRGITLDAEGYVYIADSGNNRVEKFTPDGTFITKWGTYGSGDANFAWPEDVVVDPNLNIYVSDRNNGRIIVFRSTWKPTINITSPLDMATVTGTPKIQGTASSEVGINKVEVFIDGAKLTDAVLSAPVLSGFAAAAAGTSSFTCDWDTTAKTDGPHKIKIKATNGLPTPQTNEVEITAIVNNTGDAVPTVSITSPAAGDYVRLSATIKAAATDDHGVVKVEFFVDGIKIGEDTGSPYEYAWDSTGFIDGEHVIKVTAVDTIGQTKSASITINVANHEEFAFLKKWSTDNPHGLAFDKAGNLYVGGGGRVRKFNPEGTLLLQIDSTENFTIDQGTSVAVDSADNIYATCPDQNCIVKFDKTGKYLKKWGTPGGNNNQFSYPAGIAIDSLDNIYIADQQNHRIVKYDTNGTFIRKWGAQGSNDGWFQYPWGLAVDTVNNVYVADSNNQRIQVFDSNGTFLKKFGTGWGSGDTNTKEPHGVGLDAEGNVYIADTNNHRIVKYDPNGNFLAKWGSQGTGDVNFQGPQDVKVDSSFYVYVSDRSNGRIIKFRSSWKPAIELTAPLPDASVKGTTQIQANVTSDVGISKVEVYINGALLGPMIASQVAANAISNNFIVVAAAGYTFNWDTKTGAYPDAPYELKIVATNLQNKTSEVKITVVVNNSNDAAPTVSITSPAAGDYVRLSATIKVTATDDKGISKVEFYADGTKLGDDASSPYEYIWNASSSVDGEHEIKAKAYDTIGQTATAGLKIQVANHEGFTFSQKWSTNNPNSIVIDKSGNIFVGGGNYIRKFSPEGTLLLQIDGTSDYGFDWDMTVTVDGQGNIYATSPNSNYVAKFDSTGKYLKKWGSQGSGNNQLDWPMGIAADSSNNIYVVDNRNNRVVKFDSSGTFIRTWGTSGGTDGAFNCPYGISIDSLNNVYVADQNNNRIQVFNTDGTFLKKIGGTYGSLDNQFRSPRGVGYDSEGNIYVADTDNNRIVKYDTNGNYLTKWGSQGSGNLNFNQPYDVKVDSSYYVYVADRNNGRIVKFRSSWKPQIELVAPVANAAVSGTTAIQANVASDIGINKVEVYINGTKIGEAAAASPLASAVSGDAIIAAASTYTYSWNTTGYADGSYKLKLIAYNAQNKTSEVEITVIVNNNNDAAPTVSITSPAAGDIIRLSATIKAAATDDKGIAKVEFYADGTKIGEDATSPYEFTWDAKTVVDGEHEIKVTAYDTIGQTKSAVVKVTTQSHEEFGYVKKWTTDSPNSLAFDLNGSLYVGGGNRVRKYSPEGVLLLQVENSSDFTLDNDTSAAVDGNGNIYATSPNQNYVVKLDAAGKFVKKWGTQGNLDNQFDYPAGITVDGANNVYVVDHRNHRVMKFDANGTFLAKWGSQGGGDGSFQWPWAITVDPSNNIYVADQNNQRIQQFTSSGTYIMKFGSGWGSGDTNLREPRGVGLDTEGNVYIADTNNHRIVKYDPTGIFLAKWGTQGSGDLNLQWPCDVKVDALFNVYVADRNNGRIIKFRSTWRPGITLTSPLVNATVTGTVTVQASVASDAGIGKVEIYVDGTKIGEAAAAQTASFLIQGDFMTAAASTYSYAWITTTYLDGPHTLKLKAYNLQNKVTETAITVIVNNSSDALPTVSIANPKEGDILRRTVKIQVNATDDHPPLAKVEFYIDGTKIAEDTNDPYELNWDSQSADDGDRIIKVAAIDSIGQRKEVSINVVVRNRDVYDYAYRWSTQWNNSYGGGNPYSIALNNKRNSVYITFHERIEVYSLAGTFLFAITKPSNDEYPLTNEMKIAVDANGNIYVTCPDVQTVVKFDAAGKFVKKWGTKGSGNGQFTRAQGIACDSQGNVYVCDGYYNADKSNNGRVQKFTADGTFLSTFGSMGWNDGQFQNPTDIALDVSDNIYVTDNWNNRLNAFKADGTFWRKGDWGYGDQQFQDPRGIGISPDNYLFIADSGNNRIVKYDTAGTFKCKWGTSGSGDMNLQWPSDVAISANGYVYVADANNQRIVVFKLRGLPTVTITNPLKDASVSETVAIKGTVECEYGVSKIEWYIDGVKQPGEMTPAAAVAGARLAAATTTPFEFNWNTASGFLNGSHDVKVLAYNSDNVTNFSEVTVIVNNGGDTAPTVAITNLTEGQVLKDSVTVKATASDNAGVTKVEFFVDETKLGEDATSPYEYSWATKLSSDGKKKVKAVATDTIGQKSWATINVIVDNAGRFLSVAVSDADVVYLTQDYKLKKVDKNGVMGDVIPSTIRVSQFQFDPLGYLYLVFQQKQELADGKPYILIKVDPKTNQVQGIDSSLNRLMWINWSTSNNLQFDQAGNVYYFAEAQVGEGQDTSWKRVLRKYVNENHIEDIINENMEIYHWQVTKDGVIAIAGKTLSNSETWLRRINPASPADKVLNIAEPDYWWNWGWMGLFPDNRIYMYLKGSFLNLDGAYKLPADLRRLTQEDSNAPYIGRKPKTAAYDLDTLMTNHSQEYCRGLTDTWVQRMINYRTDSADNVYALIGQQEAKYRTVVKLYPTVEIIEPKLINRAQMMEVSLDQLIIAGFNNAQGKYKLLVYDLATKNEIDIMYQNFEIYHLGVLYDGSIIFDGLNLGSNEVVIGMFERARGASPGALAQAADYTYKELAVVGGGEADKPLNFGVIKKDTGTGTLSVSITAPTANATVSGTVNVQASATSDQTITKVEFYLDGTLVGTDTEAPYSYSWDTKASTKGLHAIKAKAYDSGGQTVDSQISVTVSQIGVTISSPAADAKVSGTVNVQATATSDQTITKVEFYIDGTLKVSDQEAPYTFAWDTKTETNGSHTIKAKVFSSLLQTAEAQITVTVNNVTGVPSLAVSVTCLNFAAVLGGAKTSDQMFRISNTGGGILTWTVADNAAWLTATPASGTGSGEITVSADPAGMTAGTYAATITIAAPGAANSPKTIAVTLVVKSSGTTLPLGVFSTPVEGTINITGAVAVTGWAVDDVEVTAVKIYRDPVAGEGTSIIYIGDATFVEGARPDIEKLYPGYPMNNRAGWGYMMLTNFLPGGGNGPYKIHAFVYDKEGNQVLLGSMNIGCDNGHATKPFGTIETPAQGGVASGSAFVNWGWVLTPLPNTVPKDGSIITVFVDSKSLGSLTQYDIYRADVATNFPGLNNTNGPFGIKVLDMTMYPDGVHSIFWIATDNAGNADGIGSRFFTVLNAGAAPVENLSHCEPLGVAISPHEIEDILNLPMTFEPMRLRTGFDLKAEPAALTPDNSGVYHITIPELNRMEIDLRREMEAPGGSAGISQYGGYALVGDKLRPLPIGSTLDPKTGAFSWIPGPGFVGNYDLVFVEKNASGPTRSIKVKVTIRPKF